MSIYNLWLETIKEMHGCTPDVHGNMPCDNGAACDKCSSRATEDAYHRKLNADKDEQLKYQIYLACCSAVFGPVDPEFDGDVDDYYEIMYDAADQETVEYLHSIQAEMLEHRFDDVK